MITVSSCYCSIKRWDTNDDFWDRKEIEEQIAVSYGKEMEHYKWEKQVDLEFKKIDPCRLVLKR